MRTKIEFNKEYNLFLEKDYEGLTIEYPSVIHYINVIFQDLIKISGFKYQSISTRMGLAFVDTNLEELLPFVGRIIKEELEDKINFILKVEYEVKIRIENMQL